MPYYSDEPEEVWGNPYADLLDDPADDTPDEWDVRYGLAVPKGWKNRNKR